MLFAEHDGILLSALADSHKLRFYYLSDMKESRRHGRAGHPRSN